MSRSRKLLIVGFVLLTGLGLAWPFRKQSAAPDPDHVAAKTHESLRTNRLFGADRSVVSDFSRSADSPSQQKVLVSPQPHIVAKMASTVRHGFDLVDHPALASESEALTKSPVTSAVPPQPPQMTQPPQKTQHSDHKPVHSHAASTSNLKPAYKTTEIDRPLRVRSGETHKVRHVVQDSDTLEKIAKRYLGDESRALEIFDLNRDLLDNPHLLPINAELRLPADARLTLD